MMREDLNVPPPLGKVRPSRRQPAQAEPLPFRARVQDARPDTNGKIRVLVDGTAYRASLRSTAKAVHDGDNVEVIKSGADWIVVGSDTWHEPPAVTAPPTTTPPAAQTVTANMRQVTVYPVFDYNTSPGTMATRIQLLSARQRGYADTLNDLISLVNSLASAVNANASRLNSTRDVATGTRDAVRGYDGALRGERIIR